MISLGLVTGCASLGGVNKKSDEYIAERASQRWKALVDGDFKKAYQLLSPGYRKTKSLDYFKKQFGGWVNWTGATVVSVERTSENIAEVKIHLEFESYQKWTDSLQKNASNFREKWIFTDSDWWYVSN